MKIKCFPTGMLETNTYVVWDEITLKGFILDPADFEKNTKKMIDDECIDIEYIILTHGHGDHIGGVTEYLKAFTGAKLLACKHEEEMIKNASLNYSEECAGRRISLTCDVLVDDKDTLDIGNMHLKFFHTPGHTSGGMCILIDDVLFSGDTLFRYSIGRTDFPSGSFQDIKESIQKKLFKLPDNTLVLPGHMEQTTIGDEKKKNPYVCIR